MNRDRYSPTRLLTGALHDVLQSWKPVAGYMVWFAVLNLAVLSPVTAASLEWIIDRSGQVAVSNHDLAGFAASPGGLMFLLAAITLFLVVLQLQIGGLTLIAAQAARDRPPSLWTVILNSTKRLPAFLRLGATQAGVALAIIGGLAVTLAGIKTAFLGGHDINYYLSEQPREWWRAVTIAGITTVGLLLLLLWIWMRWILAVPVLLLTGLSARAALRESWRLSRGRWQKLAAVFGAWWIGTTLVWTLLVFLGRIAVEPLFAWAGLNPSRVLPLVALCLVVTTLTTILWGVATLSVHQFAVTRLALQFTGHPTDPAPAKPITHVTRRWAGLSWLAILLLGAASALTGWALIAKLDLVETVEITAHRGSSAKAPENTLAAIRLAIEDGADYAEIDAQTCADGTVVVIHDRDLMRVGGDPRRVEDLTFEELKRINVGQRLSEQFTGERVPTLKEVIDVARGHIKLNVELKFNRPDPKLVPTVMEILKEEQFLDQCVITSLDAAALIQVRQKEPQAKTGLIVTAAIGRVAQVQADFLSVAASRATPGFIRDAHRADKAMHVWTVNDPLAMLQMIESGADNIITDKPDVLRTVLRERAELSDPEKLALRLRVLFGGGVPIKSAGTSEQ